MLPWFVLDLDLRWQTDAPPALKGEETLRENLVSCQLIKVHARRLEPIKSRPIDLGTALSGSVLCGLRSVRDSI